MPGFIIGNHNHNSIRYVVVVLIEGTERKLRGLLKKTVKEKWAEGTKPIWKKAEWMVVSKRKSPTCWDFQVEIDTEVINKR